MLLTLLLFFIIIGILILSHEFGHFISAKLSGIKVEEFGFGFPPRIIGFKKGETVYSLNLLPFGGFVKIFGENEEEKGEKRSFTSKPLYLRAVIIAAGVFFNFALAWLLLSLGFFAGTPSLVSDAEAGPGAGAAVTILEVQRDTPAFEAGLKSGDRLIELRSGQDVLAVNAVNDVINFISAHKGNTLEMIYGRGSEKLEVAVVLDSEPPAGKGSLGVVMGKIAIMREGFFASFGKGFIATAGLTKNIAVAMYGLIKSAFMGQAGFSQVAGPVGIAVIINEASSLGFLYLLQLTALLSVNLALINLIPFPGLDGGRLLFLGFESLKGSPLSARFVQVANSAGIFVLISLMLVITYFDIVRRVTGV